MKHERSREKKPGPPEPRLKIDVPWDEAAAKMIRTPPMPSGEKPKRDTVRREKHGGRS